MKRKATRAAACLAFGLVLTGCGSFQRNTPGNGYGLINVGSPRIEGRERLINERREMEGWLRDRLKWLDEQTYGVSAKVELNSFSVTAAQLGVSIDPAYQLASIASKIQQSALQHQLDNDRAQRELIDFERDRVVAKVKSGDMTAEQGAVALEKLGIPKPTAATSASATPAADAANVSARSVSNTTLGSNSEKTKAPRDDPRESSITSAPAEQILDRLADREWLITAISRMRTDDIHDLKGRTLYRLTFDTSIVPHNDASAWAVVEISVPLKLEKDEIPSLRDRAEDQYLRGLRNSTEATFRSIANKLAGTCYDDEAQALNRASASASADANTLHQARLASFRRAFGCASYSVGSTTRRDIERHMAGWIPKLSPVHAASPLIRPEPPSPDAAPMGPRANFMAQLDERAARFNGSSQELVFRRTTLAVWAEWLGQLLDIQLMADFESHVLSCFYTLHVNAPPQDAALLKAWNSSRFLKSQSAGLFSLGFTRTAANPSPRCGDQNASVDQSFFALLKDSTAASVYAATPQESVQRLSEVASNRKVAEILANLSAVTAGAGVSAGIQALRSNDAFYHALRRQPLIVGTTQVGRIALSDKSMRNGADSDKLVFSWILGPTFRLSDNGKITGFRHNVSQRTVSAELSLPAWMDKLSIEYKTYWLREAEVTSDGTPDVISQTGSMVLELPGQPAEALTAMDDRYLREPRVDDFQQLRVVEGAKAAVMITGRNLWRSTDVLIGSQRADSLRVLHDNRTILASFGEIEPPHGAARLLGPDTTVRLTLVTSEGRVHAGEVVVVPRSLVGTAPTAPKPVEGTTTRIIAGMDQRLVLPEALAATDKPELKITSKQDSKLSLALATTQFNQDLRTLIFTLPRSSVPNLKSGDPIGAHLAVKKPNGEELNRYLIDGVFYEDEAQSQATAMVTRTAKKDAVELKLALPNSATKAYPALAGESIKVSGTITLKNDETQVVNGSCQIKKDKKDTRKEECVVVLTPQAAFGQHLAKEAANDAKLKVELVMSGDAPQLKATSITIP